MRFPELALACAAAMAAVTIAAGPAAADEPPHRDENIARADALFAEGIKLRDKHLEQACAKFGESLALNPQAIGTLLNVALCDEKLGRVASALHRFQEARARAVELDYPEHRKAAEEKIAAIAPEVPYLTIKFEEPPIAGTKVVVNDRVIPLTQLEQLPVDPGDRVVVVSAPGRIAFTQRVSLARRERRDVVVPALSRPSSRRSLGKLVVAGGATTAVAGVVLGLLANRRYDRQFVDPDGDGGSMTAPCMQVGGTRTCSSSEGYAAVQSARTLGNVGTVVGSIGVAAVLAGGYLWIFGPKHPAGEPRVSVVPHAGPDGGGLTVLGRF